MTCPICGGETKVIDSKVEPDCIRRKRICLDCKYNFTTTEIEDDLRKRLKPRRNNENLKLS